MSWIKNHKMLLGGGVGAVLLIVFVAFSNGASEHETVLVERRTVTDEVRVSGTVEAQTVSDLGFETSGIVRDVLVDVNDTVSRGQTLVALNLGTLGAELQAAQADLAIKRAEASNTSVSLDTVREKYDTLVDNAYSELLSTGLEAEPQSVAYTQTPPVVSGRYTGSEGQYKLIIKSGSQSGDYDLYVFNMEDVEPIEINKTGSTPLGLRGLFVSFPDGPSAYTNTIWYVDIPNTKSSSYAAAFNAYQEALRERDRALDDAEAELRAYEQGLSIADAELARAEAEVERIRALIAQRTLTAPFDGIVTAVNVDPGESVSTADIAVSLISNDGFGVEIDLPEIDSIKVRAGNTASMLIDVVRETPFPGAIVSVNRTETVVDGVSVYEARVAFDEGVDITSVASGMTADVSIITAERLDVIAVPARVIRYRDDGTPFVLVDDGTTTGRETDIAIGLRGSDGFVEVTAGLAEGDSLIVPR